MCIIHIHDVTCNQSRQPIGGGASPDIMPCRDGTEGACVVVETGGVVDACRFHDLIEVTCHAVQTVVEPPGRSEFQRGIMTRQRGEFAGIGGFIEGEEDQCEARVIAIFVQQRKQVARVFGLDGNVRAFVQAEFLEDDLVVIAEEPGCNCMTSPSSMLMRAISISMWAVKCAASVGFDSPLSARWKIVSASAGDQFSSGGSQRGVIGGGRAHGFEEGASLFQGLDEGFVIDNVNAADFAEFVDVRFPIRRIEIDHAIGRKVGRMRPFQPL